MKATRTHRALFAGIGALFFLFAAWVAHKEIFVVHGRFLQGGQSVSQGKDALLMAALLACFGMSFFGVLFRKKTWVAIWMGTWMSAGVAIPLFGAYL